MISVAFKTVGCRLNQAETAEFEAAFRAAGYRVVPFDAGFDVAIIHGCAVTAAAERDSLRWARGARRRSPAALVVVAGCAAEKRPRAHPAADACPVDLWVDQSAKTRLAAVVTRHLKNGAPPKPDAGGHPPAGDPPAVAGWRGGDRVRALVKVQDGCPFRCAYCIVPLLRPASANRPVDTITAAVRRLAEAGCREIVLTGANLGCYADGPRRLPDLLRALTAIEEGPRIRLSSIEPGTVETDVIDQMAGSDRICRYLHLPLQSGDDGVLRRMGRRYSVSDYRKRVAHAQKRLSVFGLGADIIVGFPGETAAAFENTVCFVEELPFTNLHVFPFSPRPGTAAAALPDDVPAGLKRERVRRLRRLGADKTARFAAAMQGRPVAVLIERARAGAAAGWTGEYLAARIEGAGLKVNRLVTATVIANAGGKVHCVLADDMRPGAL